MGRPHKPPPPIQMPTPAAIAKMVAAKAKRYAEESNLAQEMGRDDIAEAAARLWFTLQRLTLEKLTGTGHAEELRNITAVAGAYRRAMMDLGIMDKRIEEEEEEL